MRILLVNPPRYLEKIPVIREDRCEITDRYAVIPPYSLIWIASILRNAGHSVELIDANGLNLKYCELAEEIQSKEFDIVIFRFTPTTFDWDLKVSEICKKANNNIKTVGICFTLRFLQKEVMERARYMDIYIPTEWEVVVPEVVNSIRDNRRLTNVNGVCFREDGEIRVTTFPTSLKNYDTLPIPSYDLLPNLNVYRPNTPVSGNYMIVYTSKGCPFSCTYCTVARTPFRIKSTEKILQELRILYFQYNVRLISFFDETFTIKRNRVIEICKAIKDNMPKLRWYCNTRVNLVDPELLKIMYEGGCRGIAYGVESGSQKILDEVKKEIKIEEARKAIKWTKKSGIKVYTSFIFGLPGENRNTVKETMKFIRETLPHGSQFNIAVPYPGTELYSYAIKEGLISQDIKWDTLYQHKAMIQTKELSPHELEKIRKKSYRLLYFSPRWVVQNLFWITRYPEDFILGVKYYLKAMKNYIAYKMEHAH